MAGQGRTLAILGAVLVAGIGGALWLAMGTSPDEAAPTGTPGPTTETTSGEPATMPAAGQRPKRGGSASIVGEVRRSKGKAPVAEQEVQLVPERGDPWTVRTNAQGAFAISELPHGGPYEVVVAAPGCGTVHVPGIALDRNEKRDVGTLWLDPAIRVEVEVRSWTDAPLAGAEVAAYSVAAADNFDWTKAWAQMGQIPVPVTKTTTDAQGRAVFPELATGRWTFTAVKEGYARAGRSGISVRPDLDAPKVKLFLGSGNTLKGRVIDSTKNAVAGAQVYASPPGNLYDFSSAPLRGRVATDAEGRYAFTSLESGETTLMVSREGAIPMTVGTVRIPGVKEFDIVLKGTASITGTVTTKGDAKPVEGATVRGWSWSGGSNAIFESATDAQGRYKLSVTEGMVGSFTAEKDGFAAVEDQGRAPQALQLREGESAVRDIVLAPGAKVSGVVKGPDGPVAGAKVWLYLATNGSRGFNQKQAATDADGRYEIGSLQPGKGMVQVVSSGFYVKDFPDNWWQTMQGGGASPLKFDIPAGGAVTHDVDVVRGVVVEGRVEGPDGPIAGARVTSSADPLGVATGEGGTFRLEGVKPNASTVLYPSKEGFTPSATNKPFAVTAETGATGVILKMSRAGRVRGTVTSSDGSALTDPQVRIAAAGEGTEFWRGSPMMIPGQAGGAGPFPVRADGTYEAPLAGLATGKFSVTATSADRAPVTSDAVTIVDGQEIYEVNLVQQAGKDLTGRVAVKQGGAPVPGALVSLTQRTRGGAVTSFSGGFGDPGQTVWAVADAEGRFGVTHLTPGTWDVTARADGFVQGHANVDLNAASTVNVELEQELAIEGVVTLADGTAVEGAQLNSARESGERGETGPGTQGWAMTGPGGKFRLTGLAAGSYRITVSPDWQGEVNIRTKRSDPIAAGAAGVKIVVETGGVIRGIVLDPKRQPLAGVNVYANPDKREDGSKQPEGVTGRNARTRDDGTFSLSGLGDANYTVGVATGRDGNTMMFKAWTKPGVAPGTANLEIVLEEGLTISGTVMDADGKPVANATISCNPLVRDRENRQPNRNATTDAAGAFSVGGLSPGEFQLSLPDWTGSGQQGLVIENGGKIAAGSQGIRLVATKGLTISGSVVDEAGGVMKSAFVSAQPQAGGRGRSARVGDDGTFELTGLSPGGTYRVLVQAPGRPLAKVEDVAPGASGVRIVLPKGHEASGRVVDEAGQPVKQGQLQFSHQNGEQSQSATTGDDGTFKVTGLAEGTYEVQVFVRGADKPWRKCGTIRSGETGAELKAQP